MLRAKIWLREFTQYADKWLESIYKNNISLLVSSKAIKQKKADLDKSENNFIHPAYNKRSKKPTSGNIAIPHVISLNPSS